MLAALAALVPIAPGHAGMRRPAICHLVAPGSTPAEGIVWALARDEHGTDFAELGPAGPWRCLLIEESIAASAARLCYSAARWSEILAAGPPAFPRCSPLASERPLPEGGGCAEVIEP